MLKDLYEKRSALQDKMKEIVNVCETEKRTLNDDELNAFDECEAELRNIDKSIEAVLKSRDLNDSLIDNNVDDNKLSVEERELVCFEAFIKGELLETRTDEPTNIQLTQGSNGSIVPSTIANRIIQGVRDTVPFLQLADVQKTNGSLSVPVYGEDATNALAADYVSEGSSLTDNVGKFSTVDLTGFVIGALALVSNKLINNTDLNVTDFVVNRCIEAISEKLETEFVVGTDSKITGILSSTSRVTSASSSAITYDELLTLTKSIKKRFRSNARFVMNDATYTYICKLKDANNRPYFEPESYKLWSYPVEISDSMPTIASGAKAIWFGDLKGYTIKETKSCEIQVLRENYATKNLIGILGFVEYDAKITDGKRMGILTMAS